MNLSVKYNAENQLKIQKQIQIQKGREINCFIFL
jgi:hypothetical protein